MDTETLLGHIVPAVGAAVGAYGTAVLTRAEDEAAGATVRLGQRLLARLLHRAADPEPVRAAVTDLAEAGGDEDAVASLRFRLRRLLADDPELAAELAALLPGFSSAAAGDGGVAVAGANFGIIATGDGTTNIQGR